MTIGTTRFFGNNSELFSKLNTELQSLQTQAGTGKAELKLANNINDISVNSVNGKVFFATDRGLVSFNTGSSSSSENFSNAFVYPNPVRPEFNTQLDKIKIKGLTENVNIKITDIAGNLVAEAQSNINSRYRNFNLEIDGGTAFWNGKNLRNQNVASGVYILMLSDLESYETKILKLMIIR